MRLQKLTSGVCASLLLILGIQVLNSTHASAGCRDYPESVTEACVAQNLAEEQARQGSYAAEQAARQAEAAQAAIDNANRDAAARAATQAADAALPADDCSRSTNKFLQSCIDAATEKARLENEAKNAADVAATKAADALLQKMTANVQQISY
jgi:hypothetical protein